MSRQGPQLRLGNTLAAIAGKDFFIKRGDIILGAVENGGGAHVGADLSPDCEHLAAAGAYRMYEAEIELPNGNVAHLPPIKDAHLIYLRQMGSRSSQALAYKPFSASTICILTRGYPLETYFSHVSFSGARNLSLGAWDFETR